MMKKSRRSGDFDLLTEFPNARMEWGCEGGLGYAAEKEGKFYLITDESTTISLLEPEGQDLQKHALNVYEFATAEERDSYASARMRRF